jgi:hypothetical protein
MATVLTGLALTGSLLAAAGTWMSVGWLILVGGLMLLIGVLAVPSTPAPSASARRPAPRSLSHDPLQNPDGNGGTVLRTVLFPEAVRGGGHRRIADGTADRGGQP